MKERSIIPVFAAAILLLLPVLYVGSYAALVKPYGTVQWWSGQVEHYRIADERVAWFYWPLEQVDRRLRPSAWRTEQPRFIY